jgi:F0F1-type ATP synthase membrane subunit b/b'
MKVAELKQVVDANAVEMRAEFADVRKEMREGFAKVDESFAEVEDDFIDMRREMRGGFATLEREIKASRTEMSHQLGAMMEHLMDHVAVVAEQKVEDLIDRKIAAAEVRLERKFRKR